MKQAVQKLLGQFGYGFRKLSALKPFTPFVQDINLPGASFQMWIANPDDVAWYDQGHWQRCGEFQALARLVKPNDRVLEIGSHHGFTGMMLSRFVGPNGHVHSMEAHPHNAMIAQAQLGLNRTITNLSFFNLAANDAAGTVRINPLHNSSITEETHNAIEVKSVTGDMMDERHGPFNLVKIDVEGYELDVLKGCKKLLARTPKIALEIHMSVIHERGQALADLLNLIGIGRYEGEMSLRPEKTYQVEPFNPSLIPSHCIANVLLRPKQ